MKQEFITKNLAEMEPVAKWLKNKLSNGTIILLSGPLGAGKTALTKKLLKQYQWPENKVKSPTFSLVNRYVTKKLTFYHIDLYRLEKHDPFLLEEIREYLMEQSTVLVIEWPEKMDLGLLRDQASQIIEARLSFQEKNLRKIEFCGIKSANTPPS